MENQTFRKAAWRALGVVCLWVFGSNGTLELKRPRRSIPKPNKPLEISSGSCGAGLSPNQASQYPEQPGSRLPLPLPDQVDGLPIVRDYTSHLGKLPVVQYSRLGTLPVVQASGSPESQVDGLPTFRSAGELCVLRRRKPRRKHESRHWM